MWIYAIAAAVAAAGIAAYKYTEQALRVGDVVLVPASLIRLTVPSTATVTLDTFTAGFTTEGSITVTSIYNGTATGQLDVPLAMAGTASGTSLPAKMPVSFPVGAVTRIIRGNKVIKQ